MKLALKMTTEEYYYDTMEEKCSHGIEMVERGYEDSGQVYRNVGRINEPDYMIYGCYIKYERGDEA